MVVYGFYAADGFGWLEVVVSESDFNLNKRFFLLQVSLLPSKVNLDSFSSPWVYYPIAILSRSSLANTLGAGPLRFPVATFVDRRAMYFLSFTRAFIHSL